MTNVLDKRIDFSKLTHVDILRALITGLENPTSDHVGMLTYFSALNDGKCSACAATNALLELHGKENKYALIGAMVMGTQETPIDTLSSLWYHYDIVYNNMISRLEEALNYLRAGYVFRYNATIEGYGGLNHLVFPEVPKHLPILSSNFSEEELNAYKEWLSELEKTANDDS